MDDQQQQQQQQQQLFVQHRRDDDDDNVDVFLENDDDDDNDDNNNIDAFLHNEQDIREEVRAACRELRSTNPSFDRVGGGGDNINDDRDYAVRLNLSNGSTVVTPAEDRVLMNALRVNTTLKKLSLILSFVPTPTFFEYLTTTFVPYHPTLEKLLIVFLPHGYTCHHVANVARAAKRSKSLKLLAFGNIRMTGTVAKCLADELRDNHSLQDVCIFPSEIDAYGAQLLSDALFTMESLKTFCMDGTVYEGGGDLNNRGNGNQNENDRGDGGDDTTNHHRISSSLSSSSSQQLCVGTRYAIELAVKLILHKRSIKNIILETWKIDDDGCKILADAIRHTSTLVCMLLSSNACITDAGVDAFKKSLHINHSLVSLQLDVEEKNDMNANDDDDGLLLSGHHDHHQQQQRRQHQIDRLCQTNLHLCSLYTVVLDRIHTIPLKLWSSILASLQEKPNLMYSVFKRNPELLLMCQGRQQRQQQQQERNTLLLQTQTQQQQQQENSDEAMQDTRIEI